MDRAPLDRTAARAATRREPASTEVADLADTLIDLQQARHDADHDHLAVVSKATAFAAILDATEAIEGLAAAPGRDKQAFFALISLRSSLC